MLPNLKSILKVAIDNRCRLLIVAADGEKSRLLEPWLAYESPRHGLTFLARQVRGHTSNDESLPRWRNFPAASMTQITLLKERFEPDDIVGYSKLRAQIKRKPFAEIRIDSPYTELGETPQGPEPISFGSTQTLHRP